VRYIADVKSVSHRSACSTARCIAATYSLTDVSFYQQKMNDLLRAIIEQPENNQLRLIYADWLEERGDPRAAFIRVQISLQAAEARSPQWRELKHREHQLLREFGDQWLCGLLGPATAEHFDRGFLGHVSMGAQRLAKTLKRLKDQPVTSLRLESTVSGSGAAAFFSDAWFQRVRSLEFSPCRPKATVVQRLATSRNLCNLEHLNLGGGDPGKNGMRALWQGELTSLKSLAMQIKAVHKDAWAAAAASKEFQRLEQLELSVSTTSGDEYEAAEVALDGLSQACPFASLRSLRLCNFPRAIEPFARFFNRMQLPAVETLDFSGTPLRDAEIELLAANQQLLALNRLNISGATIGNYGAQVLANSALATRLEWLFMPFDTGRLHTAATQKALQSCFCELESQKGGDLYTGVPASVAGVAR